MAITGEVQCSPCRRVRERGHPGKDICTNVVLFYASYVFGFHRVTSFGAQFRPTDRLTVRTSASVSTWDGFMSGHDRIVQ